MHREYIYIYRHMYVYMCVCVCRCVRKQAERRHAHPTKAQAMLLEHRLAQLWRYEQPVCLSQPGWSGTQEVLQL